jgi:hypothetical protein
MANLNGVKCLIHITVEQRHGYFKLHFKLILEEKGMWYTSLLVVPETEGVFFITTCHVVCNPNDEQQHHIPVSPVFQLPGRQNGQSQKGYHGHSLDTL